LRGKNAPDHILFDVAPIDGMYPSLEDGISWPALLDNYAVVKTDNEFAYLDRKTILETQSRFALLLEGVYRVGEPIAFPAADGPILAEIELEPTLLGKLATTFFKPTQVRVSVKLSDGTTRDYRLLSKIMRTGFVLSPLVENTSDFASLMRGDRSSLRQDIVREIVITPNHPGWRIWQDHFTLRLKEYRGGAWSDLAVMRKNETPR
jgi:hypothetical protein